ncbi:MAG TPA: NAD(P)-dependent oxidoreductase [Actinomycetes bacterium]|nr:NAD(P)-dependent oxidoreductase [Actinomycetes bacterium]
MLQTIAGGGDIANIGFVGLGVMGGRVAKRLLDAGHRVTGYNRTRSKAAWLADAGLVLVDTARAVAEASQITFTMVSDTNALQAVVEGPDGILAGLAPGTVYVDMSTVSPHATRDLAARVAERGAAMLDAPVSGSVTTLEKGQLSIMVGGDAAVLERVRPVLEAIGPKVIHVGGNGQAMLMKAAINLNLAVQLTAFSEGLLIAEKGGIPREVAVQSMLASVIASPSLAYRAPFVFQLPEEAWFDVRMMQKDLQLALETGRAAGVPMPTTSTVNQLLSACRGLGMEKEDFAAIYYALARLSGLER